MAVANRKTTTSPALAQDIPSLEASLVAERKYANCNTKPVTCIPPPSRLGITR